MTGDNSNVVQEMLRFCYTNEVHGLRAIAFELVALAKRVSVCRCILGGVFSHVLICF